MIPTLIRVPDEEYNTYKSLAFNQHISLAEYFRRSARIVANIDSPKKTSTIKDLGINFSFKLPKKYSSRNLDADLYNFESIKRK